MYKTLWNSYGPDRGCESKPPIDDVILDLSNPDAVLWYQEKPAHLLKMGFGIFTADFGEAAPLSGIYHERRSSFLEHNLYPLRYNKAVAEITREATGNGATYARSAWAGSQRYPLHWGGDAEPTDSHSLAGHHYLVKEPQMLNLKPVALETSDRIQRELDLSFHILERGVRVQALKVFYHLHKTLVEGHGSLLGSLARPHLLDLGGGRLRRQAPGRGNVPPGSLLERRAVLDPAKLTKDALRDGSPFGEILPPPQPRKATLSLLGIGPVLEVPVGQSAPSLGAAQLPL